jgi:hypothetical protein
LQAAAAAGDSNAREWMLDLKEIALGVQQEENQTALLLQSIHSMIDTHVQAAPVQQYQQPVAGYGGGGGVLQKFLGGGFGRAIVTGAGFGIGDDIINQIF